MNDFTVSAAESQALALGFPLMPRVFVEYPIQDHLDHEWCICSIVVERLQNVASADRRDEGFGRYDVSGNGLQIIYNA